MQGHLMPVVHVLRSVRRTFSAVVLGGSMVALSALAAQAGQVVCKMADGGAKYYIAPDINISFDGYGGARVEDSIIAKTGRNAVFGTVTNSAKMLRVTWELTEVKPDPHETRWGNRDAILQMRLTIKRSDGSTQLTVVDKLDRRFGYRAEGKCTITD
jgi:hypothetical protein